MLVKWVLRLGSRPKLGAPHDPLEHELEWAAQGRTGQLSAEYGEALALNSTTGASKDFTPGLRTTRLYYAYAGLCSSEIYPTCLNKPISDLPLCSFGYLLGLAGDWVWWMPC